MRLFNISRDYMLLGIYIKIWYASYDDYFVNAYESPKIFNNWSDIFSHTNFEID